MTNNLKNLMDFQGLQIKLASPEEIKSWSHGEVTKPETINYRTLKPEKDGLFCERIFGPTKDWECYCGKYKRIRYRGIVCDKCGVEVTLSRVRRERMGHISLAAPVAHVWYFKGTPSTLSLLLNISPKKLASVVYFSRYLVLNVDKDEKQNALKRLEDARQAQKDQIKSDADQQIETIKSEGKTQVEALRRSISNKDEKNLKTESAKLETKKKIAATREQMVAEQTVTDNIYDTIESLVKQIETNSVLTEDEYLKLVDYDAASFLTVGMGAEALLEAVKKVNLEELANKLKTIIKDGSVGKKLKATKRLKVVMGLINASVSPEWMIFRQLPVIPPDLRPMVQLSGGRFATSDLNDLYRRVINRNNRLKHLLSLGAPEIILRNEKRMLQEAVDALIDSPQSLASRRTRRTKPLKSLSEMLKGKQGRFRQNLLGKRVDYSGRSVIVVGPELGLNQCGIPKDMALEMFKPFVMRELIAKGLAPNVKSAKNLIEHRIPEVYDILEEITKNHPVLLNRAPTLHKLSILAFNPVLIEGSAIRLHPAVTDGFNADFDGDQMAVHVPLTKKAQEEARNQMLPQHNLLKPSVGKPVAIPAKKEMAIGVYYLTSIEENQEANQDTIYADPKEVLLAYNIGLLHLRQPVQLRLNGKVIITTPGRIIFNEVVPQEFGYINETITSSTIKSLFARSIKELGSDRVVKLIDDIKDLGFEAGTISGLSFAISDNELYQKKQAVIQQGNQQVAQIEQNYAQGLITDQERRRLSNEVWMRITDELSDLTWETFRPGNPIRLIIETGMGRITRDTIKQLSAMRGLVTDPLGNIVELPIKGNYREGLSIFEYVNSIRGSRKGLIDTALKTADAGYLTRRLVDASHDAIIREQDCGTKDGITISTQGPRGDKFADRLVGRFTLKKILHPKTKKQILSANQIIDDEAVKQIIEANITEVEVRSPLTCESRFGVCVHCYGLNFANLEIAQIGDPVGILAAQSIGEPGTQLTMRTKHTSGSVGLDVTQGLPRVTELLEVRTPKNLSPIAEVAGKAKILETDSGYRITITPTIGGKDQRREYLIPLTSVLSVEDGQLVPAGHPLASGNLDVKQVLKVKGLRAAQEYLVNEAQRVYESQGIPIKDKHFEVIVKKMSDKVKIETPGDTDLLPGQVVSRGRFDAINESVIAEGGQPATAGVLILGLIQSSLYTESWLSSASFQDTTKVLTRAAIEGDTDPLLGMKENVIIGRLIPTNAERAEIKDGLLVNQ